MIDKILVVCTGNICRSPVAGALLRKHLPDRQIETAGLGALVGNGVHPEACQLARQESLDVDNHAACQITSEMLQRADLVLVMSEAQRRMVGEISPVALGKTMLFGRWLEGGKGKEIPDPYRKSPEAFAHVHRLLVQAAEAWAARL
ncbi:MAG: low molecular weight protein-tyrosine-phosphatase [Halomonas sp.]|nr:low molecular weight protein-tyrosine-phosphatase [Halomonas sp.]